MITKETLIADILKENPKAPEILFGFGMHCLGCHMARSETVEQASMAHGIDVDKLLEALNK